MVLLLKLVVLVMVGYIACNLDGANAKNRPTIPKMCLRYVPQLDCGLLSVKRIITYFPF